MRRGKLMAVAVLTLLVALAVGALFRKSAPAGDAAGSAPHGAEHRPGTVEEVHERVRKQPAPELKAIARDVEKEGERELARLFDEYEREVERFDEISSESKELEGRYSRLLVAHADDPKHPEVGEAHEQLERSLEQLKRQVEKVSVLSTRLSEKHLQYVYRKHGLAQAP